MADALAEAIAMDGGNAFSESVADAFASKGAYSEAVSEVGVSIAHSGYGILLHLGIYSHKTALVAYSHCTSFCVIIQL